MGGKRIRTIGQARADFALTMMAAVYNIRRLVFLQAGPAYRTGRPVRTTVRP